ncbi:MAG: dTDP-4-dehydrorhamnose 3,5-epimerase [Gemmatimonadaceae bacterium]|nr:dTDP-4-dehydrorhamnose 3,5-epimerase [Gemmatimonadaceae bacterium]
MRAIDTPLPGVLIVESPVFDDARGSFVEVFHAEKFAGMGLPVHFAQDNHSRSSHGVLRGLHYQLEQPQGKLVRPITGIIFDVAIDLRRASPYFGRWTGMELVAGDGRQVWIPPGFAHGFLVLSEFADVSYKCTTTYHAASDRGIRWNDPALGIVWPLSSGRAPILSPKDATAPMLADAQLFP